MEFSIAHRHGRIINYCSICLIGILAQINFPAQKFALSKAFLDGSSGVIAKGYQCAVVDAIPNDMASALFLIIFIEIKNSHKIAILKWKPGACDAGRNRNQMCASTCLHFPSRWGIQHMDVIAFGFNTCISGSVLYRKNHIKLTAGIILYWRWNSSAIGSWLATFKSPLPTYW